MSEIIIVSPEQFKSAFLEEVGKNESALLGAWYSKKNYTSLMKDQKGSVLENVAKKLNLNYKKEYWTMDAIFYQEEDTENCKDLGFYVKKVNAAVEHENDLNGSQGEMSKLALWDVPLGVLITYKNQGSDKAFLNMYSKIVSNADINNRIGSDRQILTIFGDKIKGALAWDFFVYNNKKFEKF